MNLEPLEARYPPAARMGLDDGPDGLLISRQLQGLMTFHPPDHGEAGSSAIPLIGENEQPESAA